jgi:cytochrome c-type biogenesis protein
MTLTALSGIGLATSFAAGVVSFLSPCVLPLVPAYVSYVAGDSLAAVDGVVASRTKLAALRLSLFFVLGFSTVFVILGASATSLGRLLLAYRYEANLIAGAVVILLGLFMMGLAKLPWLHRELRLHPDLLGGGHGAAYVIGLAFAFGWTPCIGPVLGAILTASAVSATVSQGIVLLSLYSLGLGLPFIAAALFTDALLARLRGLGRIGRSLQLGAGAVVAAMGVAILTGELTSFSYWLLETFPVLARIG